MKHPIPADLLPKLDAWLPRELVSSGALAGLRTTLGLFPRAPVGVFGLECRLGSDPQVDLGIGLSHRSLAAFPFDGVAERSPQWSRIAALASRNSADGSPIQRRLSRLWLELDDAGAGLAPAAKLPVPAVVVNLDEFPTACRTEREREVVLDEILAPLVGGALDPHLRRLFHRGFTSLPPTFARVSDVGVFLSRDSPIRMCIGNLHDHEIPTYLAELDWPGDRDALCRTLESTAEARSGGPHPSFLLHLDIAAGLRPRIGLELILERHIQLAGAIAEVALLDQLVEQGLCQPDKRAALARWPRHELEPLSAGQRLSILRLNSIKLVCDAKGAVHAKAYLVVVTVTKAQTE